MHNKQQDITHQAWRLALYGQLYLAPVHRPESVLDVGTGTEIWAIEIAETFPDAQTELYIRSRQRDIRVDLPQRKLQLFPFVRQYCGRGRISPAMPTPDGWFEALERGVKPVSDDGNIGPDQFWTTWGNIVLSVCETWGKGFNVWETLRDTMQAAGFVDVMQVSTKWPIGSLMEDKHIKALGMRNSLRLDTKSYY